MSDEGALRDKVRAAIEAGKLPDRSPDHAWGGPGSGGECSVCGVSIEQSEMQVQLEFNRRDRTGWNSFLVHLRCFSLLEFERATRP
jgi:hypothetical protein